MKINETYIEYKGKKYDVVFDMNVIETLQTKYGSFNKWSDLIQPTNGEECNIEALKFGFCEAINEGIDIANEDSLAEKQDFLTLKQIGRIITEIGLKEVNKKVQDAVIESTKSEEKNA